VQVPRARRTSIAHDETLPAWAAPSREVRAASPKPAREVRRAPSVPPRVTDRSGPASGPAPIEPVSPADKIAAILGAKIALTADEVAKKAGISVPKAREALKLLVAAEQAGTFRDGRSIKYWSRASGARPDLGMKTNITAVQPVVDRSAAETIAQTLLRGKLLGLIGENEAFEHAQLEYRLVYRVMFEERVKKPLLARMVGSSHEERLGSVYLHPRTLAVLEYSSASGLRFATELPAHASEVEDLDGVARFDDVRPADIVFDEEEWRNRCAPADAKQHVRRLFGARPGSVEPVMVPLWKLILRRGAGESFRVAMIDAIAGKLVDWP
jgi:hypothetical protein